MARVFISYSHRDEKWKDKVCLQLGVLAGEGVSMWDDRRIAAGDDWWPAIEKTPADCHVALQQARVLIEACECFRRLPELRDAEAELGAGPAA